MVERRTREGAVAEEEEEAPVTAAVVDVVETGPDTVEWRSCQIGLDELAGRVLPVPRGLCC